MKKKRAHRVQKNNRKKVLIEYKKNKHCKKQTEVLIECKKQQKQKKNNGIKYSIENQDPTIEKKKVLHRVKKKRKNILFLKFSIQIYFF